MPSSQSLKSEKRSISEIELEIARLQRSIILNLGRIEVELLHYRDNLFGAGGSFVSRRLGLSTLIGAAQRYPLSAIGIAALIGFVGTSQRKAQLSTASEPNLEAHRREKSSLGLALAGVALDLARELALPLVDSRQRR
jgi:hypothetical protein